MLTMDASSYGWLAVLDGSHCSGRWTHQESKYHVNILELTPVLRAIQHFQESLQAGVLLVQTDNTTVQSYLNQRGGGTRSQSLNQLAWEITLWCLNRSIAIRAVHLSGADNVEADILSRRPSSRQGKLDSSVEWSLDQETANLLFQVWGSPAADLFATAANAKVLVFYSWTAEPSACRGDAFQANWSRDLLYMYPPIPLLHLALHKISREEADVIAILPWWPRRGWFPLVLSLLADLPVFLPVRPDIISSPQGLPHPGLSTLRLAAWRLSRKHIKQKEFQQQLRAPSVLVKGSLREICTMPSG